MTAECLIKKQTGRGKEAVQKALQEATNNLSYYTTTKSHHYINHYNQVIKELKHKLSKL